MWNERCSIEQYVYGKEPNDSLSQVSDKLNEGGVLSLAEGEAA